MPILLDVGEVSIEGEEVVRWTIPRFGQMPRKVDTELCSPVFSFRGKEGRQLIAYPNGLKSWKSEGWMGVECNLPSDDVFFSVVDKQGREELDTGTENYGGLLINLKWIRRTELDTRTDELLPGGHLSIVCRVCPRGSRGQRREETASGSQVHVTSSEENCDCGSRTLNTEGLPVLSENLKELYLQSKDTDFVIRVRGREFRAHRAILRARIPAFDAMLTHNMVENHEGVVNIGDCDPDVFNEFLLFVYSGRVENLSPDNVCALYVLADKYALQNLKEICLNLLKSSLSIEFICDVICLAATHGEAELLRMATDFFVSNAEEILVTVRWQQFLAENPTQGNELLLKTLKLGYTKTTRGGKRK